MIINRSLVEYVNTCIYSLNVCAKCICGVLLLLAAAAAAGNPQVNFLPPAGVGNYSAG